MAVDAGAIDRFDAFLDDLVHDRPATGHDVDPGLSSTAARLHAAASGHRPNAAFAAHLRRSLINKPSVVHASDVVVTSDPPPVSQPHRRIARERRTFLTERLAIAAVALILIAGLAATGRLSLPNWFSNDESPYLAAPSVPTHEASPTSNWTGYAGASDGSVRVSVSGTSETNDPFPLGSTVVTTTDSVNVRSDPIFDEENIIERLDAGSELLVRGPPLVIGSDAWLPVRDLKSGVDGYILVDFVALGPTTARQTMPTPTPAPGSIAILFIVDKSGSMSYDPLGQTSKLEWEKETVRRAVAELPNGSQIGVLVFNDQYTLAVPMSRIESDADRAAVESGVDEITADGGSELEPALAAGLDVLVGSNAETKHAILLTDGKSRDDVPSELQRIIQDAHAEGITLSVVAIGDDADSAILQFLADAGRGRFHHIRSANDIPIVTVDGSRIIATPIATPFASPVPPVLSSPAQSGRTSGRRSAPTARRQQSVRPSPGR